jgi:acyl carrier protein
MTDENTILHILSKLTGLSREFLTLNSSDSELWDSFTKVEIIMMLERELGINFEDEEMDSLTTVARVVEAVARKSP